MTVASLQFITGFMVGLEFPMQNGVIFVLDLGIIRIVLETVEVEVKEKE